LPYIGEGWYRKTFNLKPDAQQRTLIQFDGVMSEPQVYLNGKKVGEWKYGYSYFYFDITDLLCPDGKNTLVISCSNKPKSSRWYPGAGIYRKVRLITKNKTSIDHWGAAFTTPHVHKAQAQVNLRCRVTGQPDSVVTSIYDKNKNLVAQATAYQLFHDSYEQNIAVRSPKLWSPEHPDLYTTVLEVYKGGQKVDRLEQVFGIRTLDYSSEGFKLNGKVTKFKGVCLHHDLGPLGTAVNTAALRRQLQLLKGMGCNAIRSAHNMPSPEQLQLCDEMGFMVIAESFDEWKEPKVENGYHRYFDNYVDRDVNNLVQATRNHPSIVMWSAGNEVPDQWGSEGVKRARYIQDLFHQADPTRPVTVGMDQVKATMASGFGAILDVPGLNYRVHLYEEAFEKFPQGFLLGSETASTVSSRGVYKFPLTMGPMVEHEDLQSSSYDLEYCSWSNLPDDDFILEDDKPWVIGQFVWTGFEYLGEPTPYDAYWPARSSYFGIFDLAGIPKDRYYLYRSRWNDDDDTLHILPHWNWEGREGQTTPVFVYTNHPQAELFVNGKSQGIQKKTNKGTPQERYRLMWQDVIYEPGTVKVIALDSTGTAVGIKEIKTAGTPHHLVLDPDRKTIKADGEDLSFITASVVDKEGNLCPNAANLLEVKVEGAGIFKAVCNGDPTSLRPFHLPTMPAFSGKLVFIVQSSKQVGSITARVTSLGLKTSEITISSNEPLQ
ncbi:glycoside hydrolase family 2 TIM barrel-domain containing protein, partial [Rubrivirga sp.]|uniref:glycoside hydrolase family 2 TIM barrel-domain containing protein n=1 Tax=Rubrivirga sp. TaxID=1885344 RepID=UPI003C778072